MKKSLIAVSVFAALVCFSTVSYADLVSSNVGGCGIGTKVMKGSDSLVGQLAAMCVNSTCGYTQLGGITTGTAGCTKFRGIVFNGKVDTFIASNMDNLANDIAKGNGEYLDTLCTLLEVDSTQRSSFKMTLQNNFSSIYTSESVTSNEVKANIEKVLNS